jgi:LysM repeat protein
VHFLFPQRKRIRRITKVLISIKSIKIEKGDTLWDIANENLPEKYSSTEEYVKVLKEINGLSSDKIYSGENLMIMYMTE